MLYIFKLETVNIILFFIISHYDYIETNKFTTYVECNVELDFVESKEVPSICLNIIKHFKRAKRIICVKCTIKN